MLASRISSKILCVVAVYRIMLYMCIYILVYSFILYMYIYILYVYVYWGTFFHERVLGHSLSRTFVWCWHLEIAIWISIFPGFIYFFPLLLFLSGADLSFSFFLFPFFFFVRCWHLGEDVEDCAVLSAVAAGRISETRYASYAHMILEHFPHVSS